MYMMSMSVVVPGDLFLIFELLAEANLRIESSNHMY